MIENNIILADLYVAACESNPKYCGKARKDIYYDIVNSQEDISIRYKKFGPDFVRIPNHALFFTLANYCGLPSEFLPPRPTQVSRKQLSPRQLADGILKLYYSGELGKKNPDENYGFPQVVDQLMDCRRYAFKRKKQGLRN